jgi:hypothetical protein
MLVNNYNLEIQSKEWILLNLNQVYTSRQKCFHKNNLIVGMNAIQINYIISVTKFHVYGLTKKFPHLELNVNIYS